MAQFHRREKIDGTMFISFPNSVVGAGWICVVQKMASRVMGTFVAISRREATSRLTLRHLFKRIKLSAVIYLLYFY